MLRRDPLGQVVALADGRVLVRHRRGLSVLAGVAIGEVEAVLAAVDGRRTAEEVVAAVSGPGDPGGAEGLSLERAREILERLAGELIFSTREAAPATAGGAESRSAGSAGAAGAAGRPGSSLGSPVVFVVSPTGEAGAPANGSAIARVAAELSAAGIAAREWIGPLAAGFFAGPSGAFSAFGAADSATEDVTLVVLVGEGATYGELFALQAACLDAGLPCLPATADPDGLRLGPLVAPGGASPCLACAVLAGLAPLGLAGEEASALARRLASVPLAGEPALPALLAALVREAHAAIDPAIDPALDPGPGSQPGMDRPPTLLAGATLYARDGRLRRLPIERLSACPVCGGAEAGRSALAGRAAGLAALAEAERAERFERRPAVRVTSEPGARPFRIGVVGGGTAGWLAALALARKVRGAQVTLIESAEIPVIGVGEATTPLMPQFLHADLGLDVGELFAAVRPTLKLGIHFDWGAPDGPGFAYPFGPVRPLEALLGGGDLTALSLRGALMAAGKVPVELGGSGRARVACGTEVAYHLDNRRFAAYLRAAGLARGIERVEATIAEVEVGEGGEGGGQPADGPEVAGLVAADGRRFAFDLYVDCTGFRSLIVGQALGSPWQSYGGSLFTDAAIVAPAPHGGRLASGTRASTFDAGWCWSIPQEGEDHRGYVFSTAFLDPAAAEAEMRRAHPEMGDARLIRFAAGRRRAFWAGNAVALGNAYGFVEPLESTSLHMTIRQIGLLAAALPLRPGEHPPAALLDCEVGALWDYVAWFLALHFRFNRRRNTLFWRACREEVDVSRHQELLTAFQARGPVSYDPAARAAFRFPDPLWGAQGIDTLLLGQGVPCFQPTPGARSASTEGRPGTSWADAWAEQRRLHAAITARSLPHADALALLHLRPEMLESLVAPFLESGPAFPR